MKSKTTTYILLAGVLVIWGWVFYTIFNGLNSDEDSSYSMPEKKVVQTIKEEKEDVFVLLANYRDPFLGGTSSAISNSNSGNTNFSNNTTTVQIKRQPKVEIKKEPTDWSFLDYIGIVNNKETNKQVGLLIISGKEYMVNDKDIINEVIVLKKVKDSIWVEYRGEKKWLRREG